MATHVKICGITDPDAAAVCLQAGVDAIGLVFAPSVRQVSLATAARIASEVEESMDLVAVFSRPTPADVEQVMTAIPVTWVQADFQSLAGPYPWYMLPVFREGPGVEAEIGAIDGGRFVYEGQVSGAGERVDWARAREIAARGRMTLAGGLNPLNVGEAIRTVRPFGVDVSSGVESAPGRKDPALIEAFVTAVRQEEKGST